MFVLQEVKKASNFAVLFSSSSKFGTYEGVSLFYFLEFSHQWICLIWLTLNFIELQVLLFIFIYDFIQ